MLRQTTLICGLTALVLVLMAGCGGPAAKLAKSAQMNYQAGNFDAAFFNCAAALRIEPTHVDAQGLIQNAFNAGVSKHMNQIKSLKNGTDKFKNDGIVAEYEALVKMNNEIGTLPSPIANPKTGVVITLTAVDYAAELKDAREQAAEGHYLEGVALSEKGGVDNMKQAAKEFKSALGFVESYKDAADLYDECRKEGIKRVAVIPFEDKSGKEGKYGVITEMMVDQIVSNVMNDKAAMEFLDVISRDQIEKILDEQDFGRTGLIDSATAARVGKLLGVHEILTGKITQIIYTPERTTNRKVQLKQQVVVGKEDYTDAKGVVRQRNVMGEVVADVTIYKKTVSASIMGSYQSIDVQTAKVMKTDNIVGEAVFENEWATFTGDERALDRNTKVLTTKAEEFAPVEEALVSQALMKLSDALAARLKDYVK